MHFNDAKLMIHSAGTNVTLHKDSKFRQSWESFRDSSKVMQSIFSIKRGYIESENPLISTARNVTDRIAGFFAENVCYLLLMLQLRSSNNISGDCTGHQEVSRA